MQAIILAAGMGKRLGSLTKDNTKCMITVNGTTLIERLLNQLDTLNLSKIVLVVGYKSAELIAFIETLNVKTPLVYVHNEIYDKTNNIYSLYLAKDYLLSEDTLLLESDLIVEDSVIPKLLHHPYPSLALVAKFESWMDGTAVMLDKDDNILRFISNKNFSFEEIPDYYKTVNIYKFSKAFSTTHYVPFLEAYSKALGNNEYYEQVLRVITLLDKPEIKALRLDKELWYEIDDIQDLDIAESVFADDKESLNKISTRYGGYWRYPHMIDFCYLVNPYFPNQRLMAEIKANFERLMCEYPSGLNVNNLLAAKDFGVNKNYICIGNGASELIKSLSSLLSGKFGIIYPTFEEYPNRLDKSRIEPFYIDNENYTYTSDDIIRFYDNKSISNLVVINPDNPSGNFIPQSDLLKLCDWSLKNKIKLIVDESFLDFSTEAEATTLLNDDILEKYPNLLIVKSISKSYGVPGLRLGFVASSNQALMDSIKKDVTIWNINSFAEFYMQIFGKYQHDYEQACVAFINERKRFYDKLQAIDFLRIIPSQANYFLCEITQKYTAKHLTEIMLSQFNILIKNCDTKTGGKNYIRIAIRNEADNNAIVEAFKKLQ
ncbi:MAG: aminotransferase class I/II-fold pyridoxal phosphate-dependent enzyme [Bacteroidales bacterium]|nr:aminotransferase class I/II-fold pyridoxal phosphate-dependent enzyme [Bacteroidales bacterium]